MRRFVILLFCLACVLHPDVCGVETPPGGFAAGIQTGQIVEKNLAEISGIASSRINPGVLWVHNDRNRDQLYAVSTNGQWLATYRLGRDVSDMEDLAIGPGPLPELHYLYCGDIGDNPAARTSIRVYRAAEPAIYPYLASDPSSREFPMVERFTLIYEDGRYDAETLMIDPLTGDLYIVTKQFNVGRLYRAARSQLQDGAAVTLAFVHELNFHQVSSGDISADGQEIILRQENFARVWRRAPGQSIAQALESEPQDVPVIGMPIEPNGEGVAFHGQGLGYYTVSEGADPPLYFFARTSRLLTAPSRVLIAPASRWRYLDTGSNQGTAWREPAFPDTAWREGPAQLGYGDDDQQTEISFGADSDRKHVTTYFRKDFNVESTNGFGALTVGIVYDDGVAVFLNGTPILRRNLAPNATFSDVALSSGGGMENLWQTFPIANLLRAGTNTMAVEVHRRSPSEGDLSFDLQLWANEVKAPPQFPALPRRSSSGSWVLDLTGPVGATLFVESSGTLGSWTTLGSVVLTDGHGTFTNTPAPGTQWNFYRLRL